jgi:hypothetical protein
MKPAGVLSSLVTLLAACSSQVPGPPPAQITGEWGGINIEITDSAAAGAIVENQFCDKVIFPSPLLDSTGAFDIHGVVLSSTVVFSIGDSVHMTGKVNGATMDVYLALTRLEGTGPPDHYRLIHNRPAQRVSLDCLE